MLVKQSSQWVSEQTGPVVWSDSTLGSMRYSQSVHQHNAVSAASSMVPALSCLPYFVLSTPEVFAGASSNHWRAQLVGCSFLGRLLHQYCSYQLANGMTVVRRIWIYDSPGTPQLKF